MNNSNYTEWIAGILLSFGTASAAVSYNLIEELLRILLLIASIISFSLAGILYVKKIKKVDMEIKNKNKNKIS